MKLLRWVGLLCVGLSLSAAFVRTQAQQTAEEPLTNAAVIKLARAGFAEKTLIAIINTRRVRFDLAPDRLIELKRSGVNEKTILAMLARDEGSNFADGDRGDDAFFDEGIDTPRRKLGESRDANELNIFGSGGSSRGRTESRVGSSANTDDTQTLGSATARIIRPPAEAGGARTGGLKLERTPTLTNQAVVELVEAGFSEGTIIRRIEGSPAAFDFTPEKLAELRRRRVSDPVITAMRAAMEDNQTSRAASSSTAPEK